MVLSPVGKVLLVEILDGVILCEIDDIYLDWTMILQCSTYILLCKPAFNWLLKGVYGVQAGAFSVIL